jgi:hypothetical protein
MTCVPEKCRLLHGPYRPPRLRVGARTDCNVRGTVVITSWADARISWPRCRPLEGKGHPSLLVDDELARAVRTEAAAAVCHWWGVSQGVVVRWRKALGVNRLNNPRTHELVKASARAAAAAVKEREWPQEERDAARERAQRLDMGRYLIPGYHGPHWTAEELQLLGKLPDAEVAARIGRTVDAVGIKRRRAGLPTAKGTKGKGK